MSTPNVDDRDWSGLTLGERIRQIEAKALRKLRQSESAKHVLSQFVED